MGQDDGLNTQSLRDTISALTDKAEAGEPITMDAPAPEPIDAPPADTPAPEGEATAASGEQKPGRTAGRARDEHGKLLPGKAVKEAAPAPVIETPPPPKLARPSSWKKDFEPHWEKLTSGQPLTPEESRALAEYNLQREAEAAKGVSTYKTEWDNAKPIMDAVAPFMQDMQQHGIQPAQMVHRLMAAHRQLALGSEQDKLSMFQSLLPQYGIKAQLAVQDAHGQWQLLGQMPPPQQQAAPQPAFNPQDIDKIVEQKLSARETQLTITQFATAKDDSGNPRYPHYETVRNDMALLLEAGKAQDLEGAYKMALRLHDDLWQSEQAAKTQADANARLEAQRRAVQVAKGNVTSVRSATPASAAAPAKKGLRSVIEASFDEHIEGRV